MNLIKILLQISFTKSVIKRSFRENGLSIKPYRKFPWPHHNSSARKEEYTNCQKKHLYPRKWRNEIPHSIYLNNQQYGLINIILYLYHVLNIVCAYLCFLVGVWRQKWTLLLWPICYWQLSISNWPGVLLSVWMDRLCYRSKHWR